MQGTLKKSSAANDKVMKNLALKGEVSSLDRKFIIRAGVHTLVTMALNVMRKMDNLNRP